MTMPVNLDLAEHFKKMRELLETKGWCQGTNARGPEGERTNLHSEKAATFCIRGASIRVLGPTGDMEEDAFVRYQSFRSAAERFLSLLCEGRGIVHWNDDPKRTLPEVKELLKRAEHYMRTGSL